jgi:hypothetical protein
VVECPSGQGAACKAEQAGSIPAPASSRNVSHCGVRREHFAAMEVPELLIADLREFFRALP